MQLDISNLSKTYPNGVRALDDVTLAIPKGMFGLLGPNGAGKSTLMRIIATLQEADQGEIRLGELDVLRQKQQVRQILGYLPQEFGVYPKTSAWQMLDHLAVLKGITLPAERKGLIESMLVRVNLWNDRKKALTGFSGGMKQRFGIAQALLGQPKLLIVDEPTAGLDPGERNRFYNLLAEIGENVIVILSTHIVQDVMELCTQMAIIHHGRVLLAGSPDESIAALRGRIWQKSMSKHELPQCQQQYRIISTKLVAGRPLVHIYHDMDPRQGFAPVEPDLEDVFFTKILGVNGSPPSSVTAR